MSSLLNNTVKPNPLNPNPVKPNIFNPNTVKPNKNISKVIKR